MDAIRTEGLKKCYRNTVAVDGLDLRVSQGEIFSLLGVNGAGKTTTVKMLSCLTRPTDGDAFLNGKSIHTQEADVKAMIGVSPQETAVASGLTVKENLALMCGIYGLSKKQQEATLIQLSQALGLDGVLSQKAGKLSGGFQRRLSIAMALVGQPKILFLDEPTLGLDVLARRDLWDVIRSLKGRVTVILTTHYMEEAEALSDRIAIMKDGKQLICDTPDAIKQLAGTDNLEQAFVRIVRGEIL